MNIFPIEVFCLVKYGKQKKKTRCKNVLRDDIELYIASRKICTKITACPRQLRRVEIVARRFPAKFNIGDRRFCPARQTVSPIFNDAKIVAPSTVHNRSWIPYARHLDVYICVLCDRHRGTIRSRDETLRMLLTRNSSDKE